MIALALVGCVGFSAAASGLLLVLMLGLYSQVPFFAVASVVFLAVWLLALWRAGR